MKILSIFLFAVIAVSDCKKAEKDRSGQYLALAGAAALAGQKSQTVTSTYTNGSSFSLTVGTAVILNPPAHTEGSSYTVSPALPAGLTLNSATGVISGTPTAAAASASYTVTQTKADGTKLTYVLTVAVVFAGALTEAPTLTPAPGLYTSPQSVTMSSATSGAAIYYTVDGSTPTSGSTLYSSPISIWSLAGKTIKAIAVKSGSADSSVSTGMYSYPPVKTGQTTVYTAGDNGTNQSGVARSYTGPTAHSTYTSDYTTTDNYTGLVWKTCTQGLSGATCASGSVSLVSWQDAQTGANGCNTLNTANSGNGYAGRKDWRLPTKMELESLPDYSRFSPSIDQAYFPATVADSYWSANLHSIYPTNAIYVYFLNGLVDLFDKTAVLRARCVSGSSKDYISSFTDNGDGTIKDNTTGLTWEKCSKGLSGTSCGTGTATTYTWTNALAACTGSWRLPTVNELKSIMDSTKTSAPGIDAAYFPATVNGRYWSSSTFSNVTTQAWYVSFTDGRVYGDVAKTTTYNVRCVTGP